MEYWEDRTHSRIRNVKLEVEVRISCAQLIRFAAVLVMGTSEGSRSTKWLLDIESDIDLTRNSHTGMFSNTRASRINHIHCPVSIHIGETDLTCISGYLAAEREGETRGFVVCPNLEGSAVEWVGTFAPDYNVCETIAVHIYYRVTVRVVEFAGHFSGKGGIYPIQTVSSQWI